MTACVREQYNLLIFCMWTLFAGIILSDKSQPSSIFRKKKKKNKVLPDRGDFLLLEIISSCNIFHQLTFLKDNLLLQ